MDGKGGRSPESSPRKGSEGRKQEQQPSIFTSAHEIDAIFDKYDAVSPRQRTQCPQRCAFRRLSCGLHLLPLRRRLTYPALARQRSFAADAPD